MPPTGWMKEAEVTDSTKDPIDFSVE